MEEIAISIFSKLKTKNENDKIGNFYLEQYYNSLNQDLFIENNYSKTIRYAPGTVYLWYYNPTEY